MGELLCSRDWSAMLQVGTIGNSSQAIEGIEELVSKLAGRQKEFICGRTTRYYATNWGADHSFGLDDPSNFCALWILGPAMAAASSRLVETPRSGHDWQAGLVRAPPRGSYHEGPAGLVKSSLSAFDFPCSADGGDSYHEGMGRPKLIRRLLDITAGVTDKRGESALQRRGASVEPPIAVRVVDGPDVQFWLSSCTPRRKRRSKERAIDERTPFRALRLPPTYAAETASSREPLTSSSVVWQSRCPVRSTCTVARYVLPTPASRVPTSRLGKLERIPPSWS